MRARNAAWTHDRSGSGQWQQQQQQLQHQVQEQQQNRKHRRQQWNESGYQQHQGRCQQNPQQFSEQCQQVRHQPRSPAAPAQHHQRLPQQQQQQQQPPPPQRQPQHQHHQRQRTQQELPGHQQVVHVRPNPQHYHAHLPPQPQPPPQQQQQWQRQHSPKTQRIQQQPSQHKAGPVLHNPGRQEQHATTHARQAPGGMAGSEGGAAGTTRRRHEGSSPVGRPSKRARSERLQQQPAAAHVPQQQQQAHQPPATKQQGGHWLDGLQKEALLFSKQAMPSEEEQKVRQYAFSSLVQIVTAALGVTPSQVMLFGSGRAGLALHNSDMDILITGLCRPTGVNGGYDEFGKRAVTKHLRLVEARAYRSMPVNSSKLIAHARIPVLKLELRNGLELDISLNDDACIQAADYLQRWQQTFAVLQPLVLVLKSILKHNGLGDVATGGLGSWSLANMAIGHLMAEETRGGVTDHVGHMLLTFLRRFGVDWRIDEDAVAVGQGGIVPRATLASNLGPFAGPGKLAVQDPLSGREVAGGSHRYADVAQLWRKLHTALNSQGPAAAAAAAAASGAWSSSYKVLSIVVDCNAVLQRRSVGYVVERGRGGAGCRRYR